MQDHRLSRIVLRPENRGHVSLDVIGIEFELGHDETSGARTIETRSILAKLSPLM